MALGRGCVREHVCAHGTPCESGWMDGWIAIYSVELAYYLSYVVVWEQGMVHVMLVP